jgi:SAM-dependent methyltransferase
MRRQVVRAENRHPGGSTAHGGVVDYRLALLERFVSVAGRWLDCGCADGDYAVALARRGASSVVGTDINPQRVQTATERWVEHRTVSFLPAPAERMPFDDSSFVGVLLNEVLEHVADEEQALREVHRVLSNGGHLAIFSPNRWFPFEGHGLLGPVRMPFPVPLVPWLPQRLFGRWLQARNYWPGELRDLVAAAGFEIVAVDRALPLLDQYAWLPGRLLSAYRRHFTRLDRHRVIRHFGVSTLVVARKP